MNRANIDRFTMMVAINPWAIQGSQSRRWRCWVLLVLFFALAPGKALQACSPWVEESSDHLWATFRAHTTAFADCPVSEATYGRLVRQWLEERSPSLPPPRSLALGRAISFPWISQYLCDSAQRLPDWQKTAATLPRREWDRVAGTLIRGPELRARLAAPFADSRLQVDGIVFEKILYGTAQQHCSPEKGGKLIVPFDAQLWLRLSPRAAGDREP
nr:hypothetical protein [uncultured Desulfobulbus sp.]